RLPVEIAHRIEFGRIRFQLSKMILDCLPRVLTAFKSLFGDAFGKGDVTYFEVISARIGAKLKCAKFRTEVAGSRLSGDSRNTNVRRQILSRAEFMCNNGSDTWMHDGRRRKISGQH